MILGTGNVGVLVLRPTSNPSNQQNKPGTYRGKETLEARRALGNVPQSLKLLKVLPCLRHRRTRPVLSVLISRHDRATPTTRLQRFHKSPHIIHNLNRDLAIHFYRISVFTYLEAGFVMRSVGLPSGDNSGRTTNSFKKGGVLADTSEYNRCPTKYMTSVAFSKRVCSSD